MKTLKLAVVLLGFLLVGCSTFPINEVTADKLTRIKTGRYAVKDCPVCGTTFGHYVYSKRGPDGTIYHCYRCISYDYWVEIERNGKTEVRILREGE